LHIDEADLTTCRHLNRDMLTLLAAETTFAILSVTSRAFRLSNLHFFVYLVAESCLDVIFGLEQRNSTKAS